MNVIIVTKTYSTTLGIIRSLGQAGYRIDLLYVDSKYHTSGIAAASKYIERTIVIKGRKEDVIIDTLLTEYGENREQYFIFPTDDYSVSVIDRNADQLRGFHFPYAGDHEQGGIIRLMDKAFQTGQAWKCGFPVMKQWVVELDRDTELPADIVYPCFVKPLVSAKGYKKELCRCDTPGGLQEKLAELKAAGPDRSVLVQEYLDITQEYSMSGLCLDQEIILPAIVKKLRVAQNERGVTMYGELVENEQIAPVLGQLYKFLKSLRYTGMFDMEVFCVGETIYFNEINLRSGGPNYSYCASGVNLPDLLLKYFSGADHHYDGNIELHKTFLYEKAAMEDVERGYLTKQESDELYREADIFLLNSEDDPGPGAAFGNFTYGKVSMKERIKGFVSKLIRK